jgi:uncharacterized protein (TIGR03066 family)
MQAQDAAETAPAEPAQQEATQKEQPVAEKQILGKWHTRQEHPGGKVAGAIDYKEDKTFSLTGILSQDGEERAFTASGTWKLEGRKLTSTIKESDLEALQVGEATTDEIISVSEKEMKLKDEDGEVEMYTRTPADGFEPPDAAPSVELTAEDQKKMLEGAGLLDEAMEKQDFEALYQRTHPQLSKLLGGKEAFHEVMKRAFAAFNSGEIKISKTKLGKVSAAYEAGDEILAFLPKEMLVTVGDTTVKSEGYYLAVRPQSGGDWTFLDGAGLNKNPEQLWKMFPKLPRGAKPPPVKRTVVKDSRD